MSDLVLEIRRLSLEFWGYSARTNVLHDLSLDIARGERVALVGESGSGKSVTARLILGLLQAHPAARTSGEIVFEGQRLDALPPSRWRALRGTRMAMIAQDPTSSLNPAFTIAAQFAEVLGRTRPGLSASAARVLATDALAEVSIREPERVLDSYAFQLSGGMSQRVAIAMAMANEPALIVADEPGTALDVTVQAQTLKLMRDLVERHRTSVLFISHSLGVVREFADRIYVIYKGRIVEQGAAPALFARPGHPYTKALLDAVPRLTGGGISGLEHYDEAAFAAPLFDHSAASGVPR